MDSTPKKPFFSIIMPSFLGHYPTAAKDRDRKILRAIDSVVAQTFLDWELIVVADGCEKTLITISKNYVEDKRINCLLIPKQPLWSGTPRNTGIVQAKGEYIVYLDIDDFYGENHLKIIHDELVRLNNQDWVWFDDYEADRKGQFHLKWRDINKKGNHGTCNVCHKKTVAYWPDKSNYAHDHEFITLLKCSKSISSKISTPEYYICHVPNHCDV